MNSSLILLSGHHLRHHIATRYSSSLVFKSFGNPEHVIEKEVTSKDILERKLTSSQVRIKFLVSPVNPADINTIQGTYAIKPPLPAFAGNEGIAEVIDIGPDVKDLSVGDWVTPSQAGFGTWRSHALAIEDFLIKFPKQGVDVMAAAQISVNPCTAYRMLKDFVQLKEGDTVLQNGGNSAVGLNVIQLCKRWGINTINVIRSRVDGSHEQVKHRMMSLGANYVVLDTELKDRAVMGKILGEVKKPLLALNCIGGKNATDCIRHLGQEGMMVTYGGMSMMPLVVPTGALIFNNQSFKGFWMTRWNLQRGPRDVQRQQMLTELTDMLRSKQLIPTPTIPYHVDDYKAALGHVMGESFVNGKVVFTFDK